LTRRAPADRRFAAAASAACFTARFPGADDAAAFFSSLPDARLVRFHSSRSSSPNRVLRAACCGAAAWNVVRPAPRLEALRAGSRSVPEVTMAQAGDATRQRGEFRCEYMLAAAGAAAATPMLAALALAATDAHPLLRMAAAGTAAISLGLGALALRMLAATRRSADAAAAQTGVLAAPYARPVAAGAEAARAGAAAAAASADVVGLPAALLDDLPALLVGRFDANERCLQASAAALRAQRGASPATLRSLLGDGAYAECAPHLREVHEGRLARFEALWPWRGRHAAVQVHLIPASKRTPGGSPPGFFVLVFDIGALRTAQARAAELAHRLDAFVEQAPGLVAQFDREGCWQLANRAHREWLDLEPAELVGRRLEALAPLVPYGADGGAFARAQAGEAVEFECEWPGAGGVRHWRLRLAPVRLADGSIGGVCAFATDVSEWRRAERALARAARRDPLTGLPNRAQLADSLPVALARARRQRHWLALLLVDLDGFAQLNELHGHAVGDALLAECANRLALNVRGTDLVARLAGDQFVVVLEGLRGADEPQFVARKLGGCIERPFDTGERSAPISLSATIAVVIQAPAAAPTTPAALVACAALALDEAKAAGERFRTVPARPAAWPDASRPA
jgi:diguanylate cyclase (GGDEF)-like protein/PAS domain S-box-containing protein